MCGRTRLSTEFSQIRIILKLDDRFPAPNFPPRWNIPPTQPMLRVVRDDDTHTRRAEMMRWGGFLLGRKMKRSGSVRTLGDCDQLLRLIATSRYD